MPRLFARLPAVLRVWGAARFVGFAADFPATERDALRPEKIESHPAANCLVEPVCNTVMANRSSRTKSISATNATTLNHTHDASNLYVDPVNSVAVLHHKNVRTCMAKSEPSYRLNNNDRAIVSPLTD